MKNRIKEARKAAGLTQTAFAESIGISQNYVAQIEGGSREPSDRTIRDICRILNVSEVWLRTGAGDMYQAKGRAEELAELTKGLFRERPGSFRAAVVTTLLRFPPDGPEWAVLERIYNGISAEHTAAPPGPDEPSEK